LEELVRQNRFREDLYYRLNVIPIRVPPLRERVSDIPLLTQHFLQLFSRTKKKPLKRLSPAAMDLIRQHSWPGNVRELENLMERLVILTEGEIIEVSDLPEKFQQLALSPLAKTREFSEGGLIFTDAVQAFERDLILNALHQSNWVKKPGNNSSISTAPPCWKKMKKQNIPPDFAPSRENPINRPYNWHRVLPSSKAS
jgi:DNA-binding NtrC family response regulator